MKILRKEDISYQVIYVEDKDVITAYRKTDKKWEIYTKTWKEFMDKQTIEKLEDLLFSFSNKVD